MPKINLKTLKVRRPVKPAIKKRQVVSSGSKVMIDKTTKLVKLKNGVSPYLKKYPDLRRGLLKGQELVSRVVLNADKDISLLRSTAKGDSYLHSHIDHLEGLKKTVFNELNSFINSSEINLIKFSNLQIRAEQYLTELAGIKDALLPKQASHRSSGKGDHNPRLHGSK